MIPIVWGGEGMNYPKREQQIIDSKVGNILGSTTQDKVVLVGNYPYKDSKYVENLEIIVQPEGGDETLTVKIPYGGYDMQLFIGDFTGDGQADIMVRGGFGGSGGYEIALVYTYKEGRITEIFNQDRFSNQYACQATYLEDYKVSINCGNKQYLINIEDNPKIYLDMVYTKDGKVKPYTEPIVSALNTAYPIKSIYNDYSNLLIQQRIIGVANADTLGAIQTLVQLKDGEVKLLSRNLLTFGEEIDEMRMIMSMKEELLSKVPIGANPISLGEREHERSFVIDDLDGDNQEEIIFAYELGNIAYISILKHINNGLRVIGVYRGKGQTIKDFDIISTEDKKEILIGWHMKDSLNRLELLELRNNRLMSTLKNNLPAYETLETKDFNGDGYPEMVLWIPEVGNAYRVSIYEKNGNMLRETNKYNKEYYPKVKKYYEENLATVPESPISLYYLADTQYKLEEYEEVEKTLFKLLELPNPYPSSKEVKRLQEINKRKLSKA